MYTFAMIETNAYQCFDVQFTNSPEVTRKEWKIRLANELLVEGQKLLGAHICQDNNNIHTSEMRRASDGRSHANSSPFGGGIRPADDVDMTNTVRNPIPSPYNPKRGKRKACIACGNATRVVCSICDTHACSSSSTIKIGCFAKHIKLHLRLIY
jgi:hypothetical protein